MEDNKQEKIEPKKVVSTPAMVKKKSLFESFFDGFFAEDAKYVGRYVVQDVLKPDIKRTLAEMGKRAIDIVLGDTGPVSTSTLPARNVVYRKIYDEKNSYKPQSRSIDNNAQPFNNDYVMLYESNGDADAVLTSLRDTIEEYDKASVADLYDFSGLETKSTDFRIGWTDLRFADVVRLTTPVIVKDQKTNEEKTYRYSLRLPKPRPID